MYFYNDIGVLMHTIIMYTIRKERIESAFEVTRERVSSQQLA